MKFVIFDDLGFVVQKFQTVAQLRRALTTIQGVSTNHKMSILAYGRLYPGIHEFENGCPMYRRKDVPPAKKVY